MQSPTIQRILKNDQKQKIKQKMAAVMSVASVAATAMGLAKDGKYDYNRKHTHAYTYIHTERDRHTHTHAERYRHTRTDEAIGDMWMHIFLYVTPSLVQRYLFVYF